MRGFGYTICTILPLLCVFLIVCSSAFSAKETVDVFGMNIYIVEAEGFEKAPKGSVVLVQKTTAYSLSEGKLVLYSESTDNKDCSLGYVENIYVVDGQYYLTVSDGEKSVEVAEQRIIGRADYSSTIAGTVLSFIKTPFGIFCVAVLPCIALILYDLIRAAASRMPDPEVEPQYKNADETGNLSKAVSGRRSIAVNSDGKASYAKRKDENAGTGDAVLFNYDNNRNTNAPKKRPADKTASIEKPIVPEKPKLNPAAMAPKKPVTTDTTSIKKINNTNEIPQIPKREPTDAFFTQTSSSSISHGIPKPNNVPQIGRQIPKQPKEEPTNEEIVLRPLKSAGKRSSQILASKRVEDLIDDDDDVHSKKRVANSVVDDIISGIK